MRWSPYRENHLDKDSLRLVADFALPEADPVQESTLSAPLDAEFVDVTPVIIPP